MAIAAISASRSRKTNWNAKRWNGRRPADRVRAASPGSSRRNWQAGLGYGSSSVEELKRIDRRRTLTDLEVKLRRARLARLSRLGDDLAALDGVAALDQ